jgi:hypothetical protein
MAGESEMRWSWWCRQPRVDSADDSNLREPWAAWQSAVRCSGSQLWVDSTAAAVAVAASPGVSDCSSLGRPGLGPVDRLRSTARGWKTLDYDTQCEASACRSLTWCVLWEISNVGESWIPRCVRCAWSRAGTDCLVGNARCSPAGEADLTASWQNKWQTRMITRRMRPSVPGKGVTTRLGE